MEIKLNVHSNIKKINYRKFKDYWESITSSLSASRHWHSTVNNTLELFTRSEWEDIFHIKHTDRMAAWNLISTLCMTCLFTITKLKLIWRLPSNILVVIIYMFIFIDNILESVLLRNITRLMQVNLNWQHLWRVVYTTQNIFRIVPCVLQDTYNGSEWAQFLEDSKAEMWSV